MSDYSVKNIIDPKNPWAIFEGEEIVGRFPEKNLAVKNMEWMENKKEEKA